MAKYYYTIGEVSNLLGVKPYVVRYWESEFSFLKPRKGDGRIRKYSSENIELLKRIKDMLYNQRFTIEGARQKIKAERSAERQSGKSRTHIMESATATEAVINTIKEIRAGLQGILRECDRLHKDHK
jgi:DNA-binding transcriptional MerR regulator